MSNYWNFEKDTDDIICPYCGKEYIASYEDTYINDEHVDCYKEQKRTCKCDNCGKDFTLSISLEWRYYTETIDGECTEEEAEGLTK